MKVLALLIFALAVLFGGCTKEDTTSEDHLSPHFVFKTDSGYTAVDDTVAVSDTLQTGVIVDKTDDALITFELLVAYDGSLAQTRKDSVHIGVDHFSHDEQLIMRNTAGTEKWTYKVYLGDGNTVTRSLTFVVQ